MKLCIIFLFVKTKIKILGLGIKKKWLLLSYASIQSFSSRLFEQICSYSVIFFELDECSVCYSYIIMRYFCDFKSSDTLIILCKKKYAIVFVRMFIEQRHTNLIKIISFSASIPLSMALIFCTILLQNSNVKSAIV